MSGVFPSSTDFECGELQVGGIATFEVAHLSLEEPTWSDPTVGQESNCRDDREILEAYFQKKIWGKREHNFANGAKTAAEAALRPQKGRVL